MYSRIFRPPGMSYFLLGARGTGKSTFLRQAYGKQAHVINLLDERLYQSYLANIGRFYEELQGLPAKSMVIVDEIQRLPQLLNEVHRLIEEKKLKFVLSGSSARKLKKSGVNLLAGRAAQCFMHPFVPEELGEAFQLEKALRIGTLPLVWDSDDPKLSLESYVQLYLKEEIQAEAIVRNLSGFARFMPIASLYHGQVLNTSSVARDAEVSRTTVEGFLSILEDTLLAFRLPAYAAKLRVREKKKPKFYFVDCGIVRTLKGVDSSVTPDERGHLFEGFVAQLLRSYRSYRGVFDEVYYWSPAEAQNTEVDFLLKRKNEFIAIECKSSANVSKLDLNGLRAIGDLKGLKRRILVYLGSSKRSIDGIEILPFPDFLKLLENNKL